MGEETKTLIQLRTKGISFSIFIDVIMVILVIINLVFITFDWSFKFAFFKDFVQSVSNDFFIYYRDIIHPDFLLYDSFFVLIFLSELLIQWTISMVKKTYARWWFYPFINWYDVLGCIPLGAFIWLRLFRIFAITIRLHKAGVINLRRTYIYKQLFSIYQTFVQDAADRALIKLIESGQRGLRHESNENVLAEAIKPEQNELAKVISAKIHSIVESNYQLHRDDLKEQIGQVIKEGFDNSAEMKKLEQIPILGNRISNKLEEILNDISFQLADSLSSKLASDEVEQVIERIVKTSLDSILNETNGAKSKTESDKELDNIMKDVVYRVLQKIKENIDENRKSRTNIPEPDGDLIN